MDNTDTSKGFTVHLRHGAYALAGGYLSLLPQFSPIFSEQSRFNLYWNYRFYAAILTSVCVVALVYLIAFKVIHRLCPRPLHRGFIYAAAIIMWAVLIRCFVAIAAGADYLLEPPWSYLDTRLAKFGYYLALSGLLVLVFRDRFVRAMQAAYLSIALVTVIMLGNAAFYDTREVQTLPPLNYAPADHPEGLTNIYIFMFDEWSYLQTFIDGQLAPFMTNLMALAEQANVYHEAYAPGTATIVTIPKFLFQRDRDFVSKSYAEVERRAYAGELPRDKSIFGAHTNHFRAALGFQIDYPRLVGMDCDYTGTVPVLVVGMGYRAWLRYLLSSQYVFLNHFGIRVHRPEILGQEGGATRFLQLYDKSREIMDIVDRPTYAHFHFSLPHSPFLWDRDGAVPGKKDIRSPTVENYRGNLRYLDRVIGEIVELLRQKGKYDNSLLILTSDHSWRKDPAYVGDNLRPPERHDRWREEQDRYPRSFLKHVPLIVKEPGQTTGRVVWDEVDQTDLYERYIRPLPH